MNKSVSKKVAEEFVANVRAELLNVRSSFIKIGYFLETAKNLKYYEKLNFNNFEEMSETLFGFKKSTAYGLCAVWDNFHDKNNKESIDERFKEFNYSQLLELSRNCYNAPGLLKIVKPSDSVVDIRKFITFWNKYAQKHSTTPDGSSIKEIFETYKVGVLETPALPNIEKQEKSNYIEVIQDSSAIDVTKRLESSNSQNILNNFEETSEEFFQISGKNESSEDIEIQKEPPIIITAQPCKAIVKGFKKLKNDNERLEFLKNCSLWPLWLEIPELDLKVYKIGLSDGSVILAYVSFWISPTENIYPSNSFRFFEKNEKVKFTSYFSELNVLVDKLRRRQLQVPDFKETNND